MPAEATTLGGAVAAARARFVAADIADPVLDARLIVAAATGASGLAFVTAPQTPVDAEAAARIAAHVERRLAGEPVHRILGRREFHGLDLALNADTLEPRDDSEALVELALALVGDRARAWSILDLGTGTGAIALALLAELPNATAVGVDIADGAVGAARENAGRAGLAPRFTARRASWFQGVKGRFDLIVSNPPYVRSGDIGRLAAEVRDHDPRAALDGGADGLDAYRAIAAGAGEHLVDGGAVAVEIGFDQKGEVEAIFAAAGFRAVGERRDLGGRDRALAFRLGE